MNSFATITVLPMLVSDSMCFMEVASRFCVLASLSDGKPAPSIMDLLRLVSCRYNMRSCSSFVEASTSRSLSQQPSFAHVLSCCCEMSSLVMMSVCGRLFAV